MTRADFITHHVPAAALLACLLLVAQVAVAAEAPAAATEKWKGEIDIIQAKLDILVVFTPGDAARPASATIDIPVQGVAAVALADVTYAGKDIRFSLQPAGAVFALERSADGASAGGTMEQFGHKFVVTLKKVTDAEAADVGPRRPQTPRPPFPYEQREVAYVNPADGTKLAGTLTLPAGKGPFPAVLLITGSGPQDRDESLFAHKPFAVIADHLTRQGVAVLRVDDRGVGGSSGSTMDSSADDFVGDVLAGIEQLKKTPEIDARRIGLLGHSEGGIVAPMVAARSSDVALIVLLAGTGLPGDRILSLQLEAILKASGVPEDNIRKQIEAQAKVLEVAKSGADEPTLREHIRKLIELQSGGAAATDQAVEPHLASLRTKWFRSFLTLDPAVALRKVRCPVLALNGMLDTQVPCEVNLRAIEAALREAGNADVTTRPLPGMNHLFQHAVSGAPQEYVTIEETIAPEVLTQIADWVKAKTRK